MPRSPGSPAEERITIAARDVIVDEIESAAGSEVFFIGMLDGDGLVLGVEVYARGNEDMVPAVAGEAMAGDVVIHNHPSGILAPSDADVGIASHLGSQGVGFYIVDNDCRRVYAVVEPGRAPEPLERLDPVEVAAFLGPDGPLASAHPNYEERPFQCRMAADVAEILDDGSVGVLEAGTGTGKSLAYLVPAALWSLKGGRRVVIATRTINLQEQILSSDLPVLEKALGIPVKAALVKGRGNYCCLRKRDMLEGEDGGVLLDFDDLNEVRQLLAWSRKTSDGSLSDLSFIPGDSNWALLKSESDSCIKARCSHFSNCFFYTARLKASSAQILLANHHILFADLALRSEGDESAAIMPRYEAVILDEAHNVEDIVLSYFDGSLSRWSLMGHFGRIVSRRRSERGLAPYLRQRVATLRFVSERAREDLLKRIEELGNEVRNVRDRLEVLLNELGEILVLWLGGRNTNIGAVAGPESGVQGPEGNNGIENKRGSTRVQDDFSSEVRWRITSSLRDEPQWTAVRERIEEMISLIGSALAPLRKITGKLGERQEEGYDDLEHAWADLSAVYSRLDAARSFLKRILEEEGEEVFWAEVRGRGDRLYVSLHLTPLNAAPILHQILYSKIPPIILTSATLTVAERFDFLDSRLGFGKLPDREIIHRIYPSSFDLTDQMRLAVVDGIPDPGKPGFVEALSRAVTDCVLASGGGGLILFTSYRTLTRVHEICQDSLQDVGIRCLRQGEAPRSVLLESFRADPDSVLFATDSFWEGVDVVGSSLRLVLLARLPFPVPTDPINEARSEILQGEGRDPFMEDSVPRAVIRMRQGIGRLIRHRDDRGYVVICDGRIVRRAYGRTFLQSMGDIPVRRAGLEDLLEDIGEFLRR